MCEHWLLLLKMNIFSDMDTREHLFLNALSKRIAEGTNENHTSLQLTFILLKSDKEILHF